MLDIAHLHRGGEELRRALPLGIKVFDEKGNKLADIKIGNGDFCGYVFSFPEGRRAAPRPWPG